MIRSILCLCLCLVLCGSGGALAEVSFTEEDFPHIDGSTATLPLHRAIRAHFLGEAAVGDITHSRTADAYDYLAYGETGLILVTYPSVEDISSFLEDAYNDELDEASPVQTIAELYPDTLELIPVVRDALVFLNNVENPVENLSQQQLRDIYQGKLTNWQEAGGEDVSIIPYQRSGRSGSQTLFLELLMGDEAPMEAPTAWQRYTMGDLLEVVGGYENARAALGYSVFYYVRNMYGMDTIRLLAVDGVEPTEETIASGTYPLCTYYYAVMPSDLEEDAPERRLVEWLLSDEGQRVAAEAGYVPLAPLGEEAP